MVMVVIHRKHAALFFGEPRWLSMRELFDRALEAEADCRSRRKRRLLSGVGFRSFLNRVAGIGENFPR
jgi:hypothetical protein